MPNNAVLPLSANSVNVNHGATYPLLEYTSL